MMGQSLSELVATQTLWHQIGLRCSSGGLVLELVAKLGHFRYIIVLHLCGRSSVCAGGHLGLQHMSKVSHTLVSAQVHFKSDDVHPCVPEVDRERARGGV